MRRRKSPHSHWDLLRVFEVRRVLQLVTTEIENRVIGIGAVLVRSDGAVRIVRRLGILVGDRLIAPFQIVERNRDVFLADAEEPADADHHRIGFAAFVDDHFADIADLVVVLIVHVDADELRRTPLIGLFLGDEFAGLRSDGQAQQQGRSERCSNSVFHHDLQALSRRR